MVKMATVEIWPWALMEHSLSLGQNTYHVQKNYSIHIIPFIPISIFLWGPLASSSWSPCWTSWSMENLLGMRERRVQRRNCHLIFHNRSSWSSGIGAPRASQGLSPSRGTHDCSLSLVSCHQDASDWSTLTFYHVIQLAVKDILRMPSTFLKNLLQKGNKKDVITM